MLQSVRRHSALVLTLTINGTQETHTVIHLLFNHNHKWLDMARFVDHTQRRITVGRTPSGREISSSHKPIPDNTQHSQQTKSMPPVGLEPTTPAGEQPQTYSLDHSDAEIARFNLTRFPMNKYCVWKCARTVWPHITQQDAKYQT